MHQLNKHKIWHTDTAPNQAKE